MARLDLTASHSEHIYLYSSYRSLPPCQPYIKNKMHSLIPTHKNNLKLFLKIYSIPPNTTYVFLESQTVISMNFLENKMIHPVFLY
jgi:hypothetical protein